MKQKLLLIAAMAAVAFGCAAQETMYLIKGDQVIAKYGIDEVDYAAFALPAGVTDLPGSGGGELMTMNYLSASAVYFGSEDDCGNFQIQFSSKEIFDEQPPLSFLYLQFSTPKITDLADIRIAEGIYTLGNAEKAAPFTFYAGVRSVAEGQEQAGGSLVIERPTNEAMDVTLITDGQFTVKLKGNGIYDVYGMLKLESGSVLDFKYTGPLVVINQSNEQLPPDDVPLPESKLSADRVFYPLNSECYGRVDKNFFVDSPQFDYFYILLYEDANYANCLQLGLVVDREKYPDMLLPAGKYPVVSRYDNSLQQHALATYPAFAIQPEGMTQIEYGCWLTEGYIDMTPFVGGEIEVLENTDSLQNVKLKITLKDNAETPHTLTASFVGRLFPL